MDGEPGGGAVCGLERVGARQRRVLADALVNAADRHGAVLVPGLEARGPLVGGQARALHAQRALSVLSAAEVARYASEAAAVGPCAVDAPSLDLEPRLGTSEDHGASAPQPMGEGTVCGVHRASLDEASALCGIGGTAWFHVAPLPMEEDQPQSFAVLPSLMARMRHSDHPTHRLVVISAAAGQLPVCVALPIDEVEGDEGCHVDDEESWSGDGPLSVVAGVASAAKMRTDARWREATRDYLEGRFTQCSPLQRSLQLLPLLAQPCRWASGKDRSRTRGRLREWCSERGQRIEAARRRAEVASSAAGRLPASASGRQVFLAWLAQNGTNGTPASAPVALSSEEACNSLSRRREGLSPSHASVAPVPAEVASAYSAELPEQPCVMSTSPSAAPPRRPSQWRQVATESRRLRIVTDLPQIYKHVSRARFQVSFRRAADAQVMCNFKRAPFADGGAGVSNTEGVRSGSEGHAGAHNVESKQKTVPANSDDDEPPDVLWLGEHIRDFGAFERSATNGVLRRVELTSFPVASSVGTSPQAASQAGLDAPVFAEPPVLNQFPHESCITSKNLLAECAIASFGASNTMSWLPESYALPLQLPDLVSAIVSTGIGPHDAHFATSLDLRRSNDAGAARSTPHNTKRSLSRFLLKPWTSSRSRGHILCDDLSSLLAAGCFHEHGPKIACRYVERPLLLCAGRKTVLRVHLLVASLSPPVAFVSSRGWYARVACRPYANAANEDTEAHMLVAARYARKQRSQRSLLGGKVVNAPEVAAEHEETEGESQRIVDEHSDDGGGNDQLLGGGPLGNVERVLGAADAIRAFEVEHPHLRHRWHEVWHRIRGVLVKVVQLLAQRAHTVASDSMSPGIRGDGRHSGAASFSGAATVEESAGSQLVRSFFTGGCRAAYGVDLLLAEDVRWREPLPSMKEVEESTKPCISPAGREASYPAGLPAPVLLEVNYSPDYTTILGLHPDFLSGMMERLFLIPLDEDPPPCRATPYESGEGITASCRDWERLEVHV